jgi:peptidyl-tRNA hydrolase, PTH1 family
MRLIVGLGNPGAQHSGHRHNVGFMAAGAIARRHGFSPAREKFHGLAAEGTLAGDKALILWPQTYMNDSGRAVQAAMQFYKAELNDLTVLYDEIDLEFGKVRVKKGGGAAGHNGIRSIDAHVGPDFWRVRIGVGHPGVKELVKHYVLHDFDAEEKPEVETMVGAIADNFALLFERGHEHFMTKVALAINPPPPKPPRADKE